LIIRDFFQLPPVMAKPLYTLVGNLRAPEDIAGANCYAAFIKSAFLRII